MVYYSYWFAPERDMLQAALDEAQKNVTGTVRLKLYKGNVIVAGRKSDRSLYNPEIATFLVLTDFVADLEPPKAIG
jgi:argininosuccinate synthase